MTITRPIARAAVLDGYATFTLPDGTATRLIAEDDSDIRRTVIQRAQQLAAELGHDIELVTTGTLGSTHLLIGTEGSVSQLKIEDTIESIEEPSPLHRAADTLRQSPIFDTVPASRQRTRTAPEPPGPRVAAGPTQHADASTQPDPPQPEAPQPEAPQRRRPSFIVTETAPPVEANGWRRALGMKPTPHEEQMAAAQRLVSSHWPEIKRISVVNGKGGVGKTTTVACLAATFARFGGGGVLAWDNNPTRGTLGWRTEAAAHNATIQDMLEHSDRLLEPGMPLSTIAGYVHHQTEDRYDVLRSNPEMLAIRQQIANAEFDRLVEVTNRNYRLVVFDSGNDESAERWLRMVDHSHQLVIPTSAAPESAESATLLLEALEQRSEYSAWLAQNAVIVVTDGERNARTQTIAAEFRDAGYRTEVVPFDPELKSGPLRFGRLGKMTQEAWIRVAAEAARVF